MSDLLERTVYMPGHSPIVSQDYEPTSDDYRYMARAVELGKIACENQTTPLGSVLVHLPSGKTWEATNTEFIDDDLTGHPEVTAYKEAQPEVGRDLSKCALYTVGEPCVGCSYLLDKGNLGMLYVGAFRSDVDFFRKREVNMNRIFSESRRSFVVVRGLMIAEAKELLQAKNNIHHRVP